MKRFPDLSTATAQGLLSWAVMAAAPSPEKPAVPFPAIVVIVKLGAWAASGSAAQPARTAKMPAARLYPRLYPQVTPVPLRLIALFPPKANGISLLRNCARSVDFRLFRGIWCTRRADYAGGGHVVTAAGSVRNDRMTCQNNWRFNPSTTE